MNFLLNMNIPRRLAGELRTQGHAVRHAADVGLTAASDRDIVEVARANGEVIVMHDLDYGHLLAFTSANSPSVIIIRLSHLSVTAIARALAIGWPELEQPLTRGAIVMVEDGAVRIRALPIVPGT